MAFPSPAVRAVSMFRPQVEALEDRSLPSGTRPFAQALYEDLYDRPASALLMRRWERDLARGMERSHLIEQIATPALRRHLRLHVGFERLVRQWYRRFLRREADPAGLRALSQALRNGLSSHRALLALLGSREYLRRITQPTPPLPSAAAPLSPAATPQTPPVADLVNRTVTTDAGVQQMPSVAVDPRNSNHLVIAYLDYSLNDTGYAGVGVSMSRDGGRTWQHGEISLPENFEQGAAAPTARFDDQGRVFVSFAAATFLGAKPTTTDTSGGTRSFGLQSNNGIFVARSDDGGSSWNPTVAVASHRYDGQDPVPFDLRPDIAIDTFRTLPDGQPNPKYGNVYATFSRVSVLRGVSLNRQGRN